MAKKNRREILRARQRREKLRLQLIWGSLGIGVIVIIGFLIWKAAQPAGGESIAVLTDDHVPDGTIVEYNSDPPTSGQHYASGLPRGFYEEEDLANLPPNPESNLVHNLEHGYTIIWYNCEQLSETECDSLKGQLRVFIDENNQFKFIAFPWNTAETPLVLTSWGQKLELQELNSSQVLDFYQRNRLRAPEPNAP